MLSAVFTYKERLFINIFRDWESAVQGRIQIVAGGEEFSCTKNFGKVHLSKHKNMPKVFLERSSFKLVLK